MVLFWNRVSGSHKSDKAQHKSPGLRSGPAEGNTTSGRKTAEKHRPRSRRLVAEKRDKHPPRPFAFLRLAPLPTDRPANRPERRTMGDGEGKRARFEWERGSCRGWLAGLFPPSSRPRFPSSNPLRRSERNGAQMTPPSAARPWPLAFRSVAPRVPVRVQKEPSHFLSLEGEESTSPSPKKHTPPEETNKKDKKKHSIPAFHRVREQP
ncbi:unnamed protein product [Bursaphelenchus xylophilus]|uniref:(pine wood nematode) hypothetical protein n=1 Tax=Bursaphelenchus xylophilus TaxID=6326 RepID=A0A1I7RZ17_BURXY|nr:unnamed protein product [Bursaphelenchus xylophilus]CAG9106951.1 unnamed protein product [Bursaphelenchus xylophilus]